MALQALDDSLMASRLSTPLSALGVVAKLVQVAQLVLDRWHEVGRGDEVRTRLADVGIGAWVATSSRVQ